MDVKSFKPKLHHVSMREWEHNNLSRRDALIRSWLKVDERPPLSLDLLGVAVLVALPELNLNVRLHAFPNL